MDKYYAIAYFDASTGVRQVAVIQASTLAEALEIFREVYPSTCRVIGKTIIEDIKKW